VALLFVLAGVVLIASAVIQALDAEGKIEVRSYPVVRSDSRATKWAAAVWMGVGGIVAIVMGLVFRW
jgi:hypothetical protein